MILAAEPSILDYATKGGLTGLLIVILYGGFKKEPWWVFGWVYRDLLTRYKKRGEQVELWQTVALRGTSVAEALAQDKPSKVTESER